MNGKLQSFVLTQLKIPPRQEFVRKEMHLDPGLSLREAIKEHKFLSTAEVWINDEYQVMIDKDLPHGFGKAVIWHLSIKRRDKDSIHDWRDLQAIKNMLVGEHYEAMEVYPAESRLVDTANQYHLFAFINSADGRAAPPIGVGYTKRSVTSYPGGKARQRPLWDWRIE